MAKDFKNILDLGGLISNLPEDKIPDRNASDISDIDMSINGLIQTKGGYDIFGNDTSAAGSSLRGYLFNKNYGTLQRIKLRVRDDGSNSILEWLNPSNTSTADGKWETLQSGLEQGAVMGFAPFNTSDTNRLVLCNGVDAYSFWNGDTGTVASVTANTIVINEDVGIEGFGATGSIMVDGTEYAYTGEAGSTFTGVTPDPTTQNPAASSGVAQIVDVTTGAALDVGNILLTSQARIWMVPTAYPSQLS